MGRPSQLGSPDQHAGRMGKQHTYESASGHASCVAAICVLSATRLRAHGNVWA